MVNEILGCNALRCKMRRLLFLLFLVVFAISPIVDAYADSFCSPLVFFNDLNDSDSPVSVNDLKLNDTRKSLHALNHASRQNRDNRALLQPTSLKVGPTGRITQRDIPIVTLKSSQICPPLSSDPSPPAV